MTAKQRQVTNRISITANLFIYRFRVLCLTDINLSVGVLHFRVRHLIIRRVKRGVNAAVSVVGLR